MKVNVCSFTIGDTVKYTHEFLRSIGGSKAEADFRGKIVHIDPKPVGKSWYMFVEDLQTNEVHGVLSYNVTKASNIELF